MITYLTGDATEPVGEGPKLIVHVCNDRGGWGRGFVTALSKKWREPEAAYRKWHADGVYSTNHSPRRHLFQLGEVQFVPVQSELRVVNMIAQTGYGAQNTARHRTSVPDATPPIRYEALSACLTRVRETLDQELLIHASIHMPRIGCNLAGGSWAQVEPFITKCLENYPVFVYDLPGSTFNP